MKCGPSAILGEGRGVSDSLLAMGLAKEVGSTVSVAGVHAAICIQYLSPNLRGATDHI